MRFFYSSTIARNDAESSIVHNIIDMKILCIREDLFHYGTTRATDAFGLVEVNSKEQLGSTGCEFSTFTTHRDLEQHMKEVLGIST